MSDTPLEETVSVIRLRWKLLVGGLVLIAVIHAIGWMWAPGQTYKVMFAWGTTLGSVSFVLTWWTFLCGLVWKTRLRGLGVLAGCVAIAAACIRIDRVEYYGDMIPIFHWSFRWEKSEAEMMADYFDSEPVVQLPGTALPDNVRTTQPTSDGERQPDATADTAPRPELAIDEIQPGDWPEFRGARRDGIVRGESIRTNWEKNPPKQLWRHPVGAGWSSFAVVGDLLYTQEQRGENECVVCYQGHTGARVWIHENETLFHESMGGTGPRATPTVHRGRVYSQGATGILSCLDALTGQLVWSRDVLKDADKLNLKWGVSSSPLVVHETVIISPNGGLAAYNKNTGEPVWSSLSKSGSYSSPVIESIAGQPQLLLFDGARVVGYDIESGDELWQSIEWTNGPVINVALPIVRDERWVFVGTDYGTGSLLTDVQLKGRKWSTTVEYELTNKFRLKFNDAIYKDGMLYGADDGILSCIDFTTGERQWKRGRYGYGQLLLVDDMLLVQAESGEVILVEATPDRFQELTRFQAIKGKTWNHPVLSRGKLFVRNATEAACYDIGEDGHP